MLFQAVVANRRRHDAGAAAKCRCSATTMRRPPVRYWRRRVSRHVMHNWYSASVLRDCVSLDRRWKNFRPMAPVIRYHRHALPVMRTTATTLLRDRTGQASVRATVGIREHRWPSVRRWYGDLPDDDDGTCIPALRNHRLGQHHADRRARYSNDTDSVDCRGHHLSTPCRLPDMTRLEQVLNTFVVSPNAVQHRIHGVR